MGAGQQRRGVCLVEYAPVHAKAETGPGTYDAQWG